MEAEVGVVPHLFAKQRAPKGVRFDSSGFRHNLRPRSSMVEQLFCKQQVAGSIPVVGSTSFLACERSVQQHVSFPSSSILGRGNQISLLQFHLLYGR